VARAKRTDRADARRRYRQIQTGEIEGAELDEAAPPVAGRGPRQDAAPTQRPSITAAFRNAYRRANIREDIAFLPRLLATRSFVTAIALIVAGTAAFMTTPTNVVANLAFQALVIPPAMAPIFIVGFFARRASYLLGLVISIVDIAAYSLVVYNTVPDMTTVAREQLVYSAISVGPLSGIFFAAAAAWYRRFLQLSNARQQQRRQPGSRTGRPARG